MRISNRDIETIAVLMAEKANKERDAKIKAHRNSKTFQKEVDKWTAHWQKMPKKLQDQIHHSRVGLRESIADILLDNKEEFGSRPSRYDFLQQVRVAALECKDMAALKRKLKIEF